VKNKYHFISILFFLASCGDKPNKVETKKELTLEEHHAQIHYDLDRAGYELQIFDSILISLYNESEVNPTRVIFKTDSILNSMSSENDTIHFGVKSNKIGFIHYLRGEIFYKIGQYKKSIIEFKYETGLYNEIPLACNYAKLKDYNRARLYIDSVKNSLYLFDFLDGNYYETIGNKKKALEIYNKIRKDKSIKHYVFYGLAVNRIKELEKVKPKLLDEIYFPTGRPDFEDCDDDSENRNKIFDTISTIKEVSNCNTCSSTMIYESPQENDKNYYWVKVGPGGGENAVFNFFIYVKTFEIKFYDEKNKKLYRLEDWRKMK
jgi:tetratricopeptide (TPR) repeat protein